MTVFDNSRSLVNKAQVTGGQVGIKYDALPLHVALNGTFTNDVIAYVKSGQYSVTGLYTSPYADSRLEVASVVCVAPFTDMVYDSSSRPGITDNKVMCMSKTPQILSTVGVVFAKVTFKVKAGAENGRATLDFNNKFAVGAVVAGSGNEPVDIAGSSDLGDSKVIEVGSGIEPTAIPTVGNSGDLKADEMSQLRDGMPFSPGSCVTFTFQ